MVTKGKGKTSKVSTSESTMRFRNRKHSAKDGYGVQWRVVFLPFEGRQKGNSCNGLVLGYHISPGIELRPKDVVSQECETG